MRASDAVHGWLHRDEQSALYRLASQVPADRAVVELGSWKGRSTVVLAAGSMSGSRAPIYAVDFFAVRGENESFVAEQQGGEAREYLPEFQQNMVRAGVAGVVTPIRDSTTDAARGWKGPPIALLFVDGDHEYASVRADFLAWVPHCAAGARVAFHDYHAYHGVTRFVDQLLFTGVLSGAALAHSMLHGELAVAEPARIRRRLALCPAWLPPLVASASDVTRRAVRKAGKIVSGNAKESPSAGK